MDLQHLFSTLEFKDKDSLIMLSEEGWKDKVVFPSRITRLLKDAEKWSPKALFYLDNKPLVLFFENPKNKAELHKAVWNFNETPIVIIVEDNQVNVYNGFAIDENESLLKRFGGSEVLNDFSYFELVTGKTLEKYEKDFSYSHRVDYNLLKNIEATQGELLEKYNCDRKTANSLLGMVIFVRYLIDRKVRLSFDGISREWTNKEFCELLLNREQVFQFFNHLQSDDKGFNGNLFPIDKVDFNKIPVEAFKLIKSLLEGGDIKTGQQSLFQLYDFSVLPIEFISNVYERFIGKENQAKAGAYYTPTFLVDYIISQTVTKKLSAQNDAASCKVLDPACGSGIFLVETLRKIIEKHIKITGVDTKTEQFKLDIKRLTKENIYGVDKDLSAIQVAIFSIYLTLLDYLEPPDVEGFKFPTLLNINFFEADFFNINAEFNAKFKDIEFDFILGNPPWAGGKKGLNHIGKDYIKQRKKREKQYDKIFEVEISNNEIAEGFLLRVSDCCNPNTQIALIIKSTILYNLGYKQKSRFRSYWLQEFFIDRIFELAPVRKEVFDRSNDPAIAPAAIAFYRYANGEKTDKNIIEHITLKPSSFFSAFKIFTVNRSDYNRVEQKKLKQYDWLWKTLVFGSYLDFNFLNRIKNDFPTMKEVISNDSLFIEGTGIQYSSNPTYNSEHLIGKSFIAVDGVEPFFINPDKISDFDKPMVHRLRTDKPMIFKAPMLLMRMGLDMDTFTIKSAISKQDVLFKNSITSISVVNKEDIKCLYDIQAVFSTNILTYYAVHSFAFIGIEREQTQNYDKYSLPYLDLGLQADIEAVEEIKAELHVKEKNELLYATDIEKLNHKIGNALIDLNGKVLQKLNLSDVEKALIDYSVSVNKVMIAGNAKEKRKLFEPIKQNEEFLRDYAQLFLNRFQSNLSNNQQKFFVEVWHTNQIIGMLFKVVPTNEYEDNIKWKDKQGDLSGMLSFLINISSERITDKLFVQKDIRGFEKDYFYIFKPNERRLWHKAIGYLDVHEFADAMLKEGRRDV